MKKDTFYRTVAAIIFCLTASVTSFAQEAVDPPEQRSVVIMDTFFVHANAVGFYDVMDRAIKLAKEVDPSGGGQIHILAGHPEPESASLVIVFTTYPSMDAYIANEDALKRSPKLQAIFQEMKDADFQFMQRTMNSVVAKY